MMDGFNWYSYCNGNPLNYLDPSGLTKVMVRYAVEKNGGYVSWYPNDGTGRGARVDVTLYNPQKKQYVTKSYYYLANMNGRVVIEDWRLQADFGIDSSKFLPQEGDLFNSMDDAALAFGLMYNRKSVNDNSEYGALIYWTNKNGKDQYYFRDVTKSAIPKQLVLITTGYEIATIHTHGKADPNYMDEIFSPADLKYGKTQYLVTPSGRLVKKVPGLEEDEIVSGGVK